MGSEHVNTGLDYTRLTAMTDTSGSANVCLWL